MKVRNVSANSVVISDLLLDQVSQYQSGIKQITLAPSGEVDIPNSIAGESTSLRTLLVDGTLVVVDSDESLGSKEVFGTIAGRGVVAYQGVVKAARSEAGTGTFRIMFGTWVTGDAVVDLEIHGFNVNTVNDVIAIDDGDIVGTVAGPTKSTAAVSGNVMVTWSQVGSLTGQAATVVYARLTA